MPEGVKNINEKGLYTSKGIKCILEFLVNGKKDYVIIPKSDGTLPHHKSWTHIGEITEVQAESLVLFKIKGGGLVSYPKEKCFKDYKNRGFPRGLTALYSFKTLLQSNKVYFENPFPLPSTTDHKYYDEPYNGTGFYQELYSNDVEKWQAAQQNVWDKSRTHLFINKKD